MVTVRVGPGDDVEAWCTRCRMNLSHRVVAVVGQEILKVQCLTCGRDHKYRPPKYPRSEDKGRTGQTRASMVRPREKTGRSRDKSASRASSEWNTVMKEMPPEVSPRPYRISDSYGDAEFIEHPVFGTGRVLQVLGSQRIQVIFRDGRKVLVCNKSCTS